MTNLAKSVSVALGPLNGVAARITAITSLANRNTVAIAAMIGFFIALGGVLVKATKAGSNLQKELKILENRLMATGRGGVEALKELDEFAIKLGEDTLESASTVRQALIVISAASEITTEQMKKATAAAADLAASGFGSIQISARRLVRAFTDPASALEGLARNGLKLSVQNERLVRSFSDLGKRGKAFDVILKAINKAVGGTAISSAKGLAGAFDTLGERTTRFLEILSTEGGIIDSLTDSINRVSDSLLEFTTNTDAAAASGNFFAVAFKALDATIVFITDNVQALAFAIGGLFAGAILKKLASFIAFLFRLGVAAKGAEGFFAKLTIASRLLTPQLGIILAIGGAITGLIIGLKKETRATNDLSDALERINRVRNESKGLVEAPVVIQDAIAAELNRIAENAGVSNARLKDLNSELSNLQLLAKGGFGDPLAVFEKEKEITEAKEELVKLSNQVIILINRTQQIQLAPKLEEATDAAHELSVEQKKLIDNVEKLIKVQTVFGQAVRDMIGGGISGGQVAFELTLDTRKAEQAAEDFLRKIEEKVPRTALKRNEVVADDQVLATKELLKVFKDLGIEANSLEDAFLKLFQRRRADDLLNTFRKLELSTKLSTDAQNRLAVAVTQGGAAMRAANIESQVAAQMFRLGGDRALQFKDALEQLATKADKAREALVTSQIVNALKEEMAITKTRIKFMGETELRQNQINALIEKEIDLRRRGIDSTSQQATIERQMVLNREKLNRQLELATERQADLKGAINAMGSAFAGTIEDAIVDFKDLSDLINSLEKDLLRIITRVLITQPIERGIETAFAGVTDPTGISEGKGLESIFGKLGDLFGTKIDPLEGVTGDTVGGITDVVGDSFDGGIDEAFKNLTQSIPDAQAMMTKLGEESGATALLNAALGLSATNATGSMVIEKVAIDTVTGSMLELTVATKLATAAMAAMGAGAASSTAQTAVGLALGATGIGSSATPLANFASVTPGLMGSFAGGADFTIGGRGGVDQNLVQFMGTRGERVKVTPAGQSSDKSFKQTLIFNVGGDTTQTTVNQIAVTVGRHTQRAMAKGLA